MKRKRAIHIRFTCSSPSKANKWWLGSCTLFCWGKKKHLPDSPMEGLGSVLVVRQVWGSSCVETNLLWKRPLLADTVLECINSPITLSPASLLNIFSSIDIHNMWNLRIQKFFIKRWSITAKLSLCSFKPVPLQTDNKNKDQRLF